MDGDNKVEEKTPIINSMKIMQQIVEDAIVEQHRREVEGEQTLANKFVTIESGKRIGRPR